MLLVAGLAYAPTSMNSYSYILAPPSLMGDSIMADRGRQFPRAYLGGTRWTLQKEHRLEKYLIIITKFGKHKIHMIFQIALGGKHTVNIAPFLPSGPSKKALQEDGG